MQGHSAYMVALHAYVIATARCHLSSVGNHGTVQKGRPSVSKLVASVPGAGGSSRRLLAAR